VAGEGGAMSRTERVRVPNPRKPGKARLDAPPAKVHRSRKKYRRRPKHPKRETLD
jgi:hypothetical protein